MRRLGPVKVAFWVAVSSVAVAAGSGSTVSLTACGESGGCTKLRNDLYAEKEVWDSCNPGDPLACIKVAGSSKDCTGVLACDFAINPRYRAEAEQVVLTVGERSQGCYLCATPNCLGGNIAYCEPVTRRCIVVSELLEAGAAFGGDLEASVPVTGDESPAAVVDAGSPPSEAGDFTFDAAAFSGH